MQNALNTHLEEMTTMKREISVLVAEDHPLFRNAIHGSLTDCDFIRRVDLVENGLQALISLESNDYEVVLLDVNMPEMDGIECMTKIQERYPDQKVVILTQYDSTGIYKRFDALGVYGYLLKTAKENEILDTLTKVAFENKRVVSNKVTRHYKMNDSSKDPRLTDKELEILQLVCNHLSTQEIAEKLGVSKHTVDTHRKHILSKVGVDSPMKLLEWAIKNGIRYS